MSYTIFIFEGLLLSSHIAILSICNCQLSPYTRDVRNESLFVLYLDIHVGHYKNQYIPILTPADKFLDLIFRNNFFIFNFSKICSR